MSKLKYYENLIHIEIESTSNQINLKKNKFWITKNLTLNFLIAYLKKKGILSLDITVFFLYKSKILNNKNEIKYYYDLYKNEDNILVLEIDYLKSFG